MTFTPRSVRKRTANRPIGPHPSTTAVSPALGVPRLTACMAIEPGSPSAASRMGRPGGSAWSLPTGTRTTSARAPSS